MAEKRGYSQISPGVYANAEGAVKIHLQKASRNDRNGINLAPKSLDLSDTITLAITPAAWTRLIAAVEERRST